ncbi:MAG: hypothetical protein O3A20_00790 [Planctomycetota bacterium]|nr:hypothetical protein [Planctomycetota bacterium]
MITLLTTLALALPAQLPPVSENPYAIVGASVLDAEAGVVFARDLGSATEAALSMREALRNGSQLGPELIEVGAIIDGDPSVWPFSEACKDADAARAAVAKLADAGGDQIKLYSRLSPEAFHAAMDEARTRSLTVGGHVPDAPPTCASRSA